VQKNKKTDFFSEKEDINQEVKPGDLKPEKLNSKNQKLAEPLKICIPEEILEKIFSKRMQFKEEGLAWVEKELAQLSPKKDDFINYYVSFLGVVNYTLKDKISQIVLKALNVLSSLLKLQNAKVTGKSEMIMYIDNILTYVIEKISDNNKKIIEASENMFFELCKSQVVGLSLCLNSLIKVYDQKKQTQLPKFLVIRLKLLQKLIGIYKMNGDMNFNMISDFVIRNLDHSSLEVRNVAQEVTKSMIKVVGEEKMMPLLMAWNQNYQEVLRLGSEESQGKNDKNDKPKKKTNNETFNKNTNNEETNKKNSNKGEIINKNAANDNVGILKKNPNNGENINKNITNLETLKKNLEPIVKKNAEPIKKK